MIVLKSDNFEKYIEILQDVFVVFASPTCPRCKQFIGELQEDVGDQIEILYIDGEKWEALADRFDIEYYPTLIYFKDGKEVKNLIDEDNYNLIFK